MFNVNFIGRLGFDSEIKKTKNGNQFLSMRVATDDFVNGETVTFWATVMWFGERAIKMQEHLKKGRQVNVTGVLRGNTYKNKNGEDVVSYDVFADRVDFVQSGSGKTESETATAESGVDFGELKKKSAEVPAGASTTPSDDDLPF